MASRSTAPKRPKRKADPRVGSADKLIEQGRMNRHDRNRVRERLEEQVRTQALKDSKIERERLESMGLLRLEFPIGCTHHLHPSNLKLPHELVGTDWSYDKGQVVMELWAPPWVQSFVNACAERVRQCRMGKADLRQYASSLRHNEKMQRALFAMERLAGPEGALQLLQDLQRA